MFGAPADEEPAAGVSPGGLTTTGPTWEPQGGLTSSFLAGQGQNLDVVTGLAPVTYGSLEYLPAWQRTFSEQKLPIELAILEPRRVQGIARQSIPLVNDENGLPVLGCDGNPLLNFRINDYQVLPNKIPPQEKSWRLLAWLSWAPEITIKDIVVRMHQEHKDPQQIEKEARRLNAALGRFRKERGGLPPVRTSAIAKIEMHVIDRLIKPPFNWELNAAYNTIWIVNEEAGTVTQPGPAESGTANTHKLADLGPPQPISTRLDAIYKQLHLKIAEAELFNTTWDKLEHGDPKRHQSRKETLAARKAQGLPVFNTDKQRALPGAQPEFNSMDIDQQSGFVPEIWKTAPFNMEELDGIDDDTLFNFVLSEAHLDYLVAKGLPVGFRREWLQGPILPPGTTLGAYKAQCLDKKKKQSMNFASLPPDSMIDPRLLGAENFVEINVEEDNALGWNNIDLEENYRGNPLGATTYSTEPAAPFATPGIPTLVLRDPTASATRPLTPYVAPQVTFSNMAPPFTGGTRKRTYNQFADLDYEEPEAPAFSPASAQTYVREELARLHSMLIPIEPFEDSEGNILEF
ncbi:MAG: hypothetical protein M1821_009031 [Bathelium mastoideum]|nr:MAG: hypothetical protein M1821_009031 [Bathelium mastoideum]